MKKMKAFLLFVSLILVLAACSSGGGTNTSSNNQNFKWDFTVFVSLEHPNGASAVRFSELVREKTDGRVDITVRPAGELPYEPSDFLALTKENTIQVSDAFISFVSGDLAVGSLPNLPFLITNLEELEKALEVMKPYIDQELDRFNAKMLYYYPWPQQNLWGKGSSISSYENLKGMKFRAQSPEQSVFLGKMGATPVSLSTPEVPAAMQRGVADGVITAALNINGSKWYDFLNWGHRINMQVPPSYIVVNKEAYERLPEELQAAVDEAAKEIQADLPQQLMDIDKESLDKLIKEHNIQFSEATDEEMKHLTDLFKPYWDEWVQKKGPEAAEALAKVKEVLNK